MKKFKLNPRFGAIALGLIATITLTFAQTCPTGLTAYWKFQETTGPTYADETGNHDLTAISSPSQTDGISGKGQMFGGSELILADHSDFDWAGTSNFTIELWAKFTETGARRVLIGRDSGTPQWWIGRESGGQISYSFTSSTGSSTSVQTSTAAYNNGLWTHIVLVKDGNSLILYTNGTAKTLSHTFTGNFASSADIILGNLSAGHATFGFNGGIDEAAIYGRALTLQEVTDHYNNAKDFEIGYCDDENPVFLSEPVTAATVGQQYTYDVDASGSAKPIYSLLTSPAGMTIDATTGVITWTPASINVNGNVVVQASSAGTGTETQEFIIYVADVPVCRSNMSAYWDFNTVGSSQFDNINNFELHGTAPGATTGKFGNGLSFDGVNDSINMDDPEDGGNVFFDFKASFTIELWMKSSATPSKTMVLVGRDVAANKTQYWLGVNTNGTVSFFLRDWVDNGIQQLISTTETVLDGNWHHVVATYDADANLMALYVDGGDNGSADATFTQAFNDFGGGTDLNIGHLLNDEGSDRFWYEGTIDELAIYDIALDASTVGTYYNLGNGSTACTFNYAPVITTTPMEEVDEDVTYTYNISATDVDGDDLTLSAQVKPDWLTFTYTPGATTAVLSGTPTNDEVGAHSVTIRVNDGSVDVDQEFVIDVINVNDEPVIISGTPAAAGLDGNLYSYVIEATDVDVGDILTYSAPVKPSWLAFDTDTRTLTGTPTPSDVGEHSVTLRVNDGTVDVDLMFTIEIQATNTTPVFTSNPLTVADDYEEYSYTATGSDADGNVLTFAGDTIAEWLTFDASTNTLSGTPKFNHAAQSFDIVLSVTDGIATAKQRFTIQVTNLNDKPEFTSTPVTEVTATEAYLYQVTATDVDEDDVLEYSTLAIPGWLELLPASNGANLVGTPAKEDAGEHNVVLKVSDGIDDVLQSFSITVTGDGTSIAKLEQADWVNMVYPNPASETITFTLNEADNFSLTIFNMNGSVMKEIALDYSEEVQIDISDFPAGIYFYQVAIDNKVDLGKFSKY